ncbi:SHOCT domain-containing protein [Syntrophomonas palmitatica]|uniref:SHOCT domain-containing protein n=1 Tax=Syntrophomonas palmitatica TaxID=402877 RepID=UPI001FA78E61|nr:SHOCT domain-containing protein [Syntrophomonas palmitatica]
MRNHKLIALLLLGFLAAGAAFYAIPAMATAGNSSQPANAGTGYQMRGPGGGMRGFGGPNLDAAAELTGKTVEELKASLQAGTRLCDILAAAGVDKTALQAKMQEARAARLQEMLDSGKITQEQFVQMKKRETVQEAIRAKIQAVQNDISSLSQEERASKMQELRKAALQELLDNGTITQDEYDKMIASQGPKNGQGKMGGKGRGMGGFKGQMNCSGVCPNLK